MVTAEGGLVNKSSVIASVGKDNRVTSFAVRDVRTRKKKFLVSRKHDEFRIWLANLRSTCLSSPGTGSNKSLRR